MVQNNHLILRKSHWCGREGKHRFPALFWIAGIRALSPKPRQRLLPFWNGLIPNFMLWIEDIEHVAAGCNCQWRLSGESSSKNKELFVVDCCTVVGEHWYPPFRLEKVQYIFVTSALFAAWPIGKGLTSCSEFDKSQFSLYWLPSQILAAQTFFACSTPPECSDKKKEVNLPHPPQKMSGNRKISSRLTP